MLLFVFNFSPKKSIANIYVIMTVILDKIAKFIEEENFNPKTMNKSAKTQRRTEIKNNRAICFGILNEKIFLSNIK
jgi:hypothetical protein